MGQIFVWTLSDVIGAVIVSITFVVWLVVTAVDAIKEWRCKHDGAIHETRACDAICRKCGKNLGFIGTWRKSHPI